jgi:TatD DNase family protein
MTAWIDTHCHLDAPEFASDVQAVRSSAAIKNVAICVIPAVEVANFAAVRRLAHQFGDAYALGIHPLYVPQSDPADLDRLDAELALHRNDPRLVAVGEIGLDYFVPALATSPLREKQEAFYRAQLKLARKYRLPVIVHVRRSADRMLKGLREIAVPGGIAHAFNGSEQQALAFVQLGFKLGFGGAMTYARATQLRHLAVTLPLSALVLETDAPDIPPQWIYKTAAERAAGFGQGRNEPGELPRIAETMAQIRAIPLPVLATAVWNNALAALPQLDGLPGA